MCDYKGVLFLLYKDTEIAMRYNGNETGNKTVLVPLYLAIWALFTLIIFAVPINYVSIAIVTLGGGAATIVGRLYGRNMIPFSHAKTIEGTAIGMVGAFICASLFVSPMIAVIGILAGMVLEFLPCVLMTT